MADAKKCDRCGSFYDRFARPDSDYLLSKYCNSGVNQGLTRVMDLCPKCSYLLDLWMEGKAEIIVIDTDRPICGPYEEDDTHEV